MLSWFIKMNETYFDHKHKRHQKNIVSFWVYKMNQSLSKFEQKNKLKKNCIFSGLHNESSAQIKIELLTTSEKSISIRYAILVYQDQWNIFWSQKHTRNKGYLPVLRALLCISQLWRGYNRCCMITTHLCNVSNKSWTCPHTTCLNGKLSSGSTATLTSDVTMLLLPPKWLGCCQVRFFSNLYYCVVCLLPLYIWCNVLHSLT